MNKYRSLFYEEQYVLEVLNEWNQVFESYYRSYCAEHEIDLDKLNKDNAVRVNNAFSSSKAIALKNTCQNPKEEFDSKKLFRQIAKKFHPDTLSADDPRRDEYEAAFKKAAGAIKEGKWGQLFDVADEYDLELKEYDQINKSLLIDIERIAKKIKSKKNTYAWLLYECEEDVVCKENVVRKFLNHLFNI